MKIHFVGACPYCGREVTAVIYKYSIDSTVEVKEGEKLPDSIEPETNIECGSIHFCALRDDKKGDLTAVIAGGKFVCFSKPVE